MNNLFKVIFLSTLIFYGCLEDIIPPPYTGELNTTAEMLLYFESNGDFINSNSAPPLVNAVEVHNNLNDYLIIDLRTKTEFLAGHIPNSINKSFDTLYSFIEAHIDSSYSKIILVSKNGQSSAYYASLLRLAGYDKVYSLNYGIASWHIDFADGWLNAIGDAHNITTYTNYQFPKNDLSVLPQITFNNPNSSIEDNIKLRIQDIIKAGFHANREYIVDLSILIDDYLICYGKASFYGARLNGVLGGLGHPVGAISYEDSPFYHFRSTNYLQTVPNNKQITVYSYNGQLSASLVAYLKVLGYTARTHLFGGNTLFYSRMLDNPELIDYAILQSDIKNYEYITGN